MTNLTRILLITLLAGASHVTAFAQESAPAAAAASDPAVAPATELHYSNRWRLQVSEGANNEGVMHFRLTPKGGEAVEIPVHLKKGRGEDGCARDIRDTFNATLDQKSYKVEIDDGEDVLVKKHKGPDFSIQLVESTVKGTRVNIDAE